jgi:hypothetical protein
VRFGSFYMTDAGKVIYQAWLTGAGVTLANDSVLYRWTVAGSNEVLAREGDSAPGTGSHYLAFQAFSVCSGGAMVLQSNLGNGKIALMRALLGAGPTAALQTGTTLTYNGATRSIFTLGIHQTGAGVGGGGGGLDAAINDEGAIFTVLSIGASEYVTLVYRP